MSRATSWILSVPCDENEKVPATFERIRKAIVQTGPETSVAQLIIPDLPIGNLDTLFEQEEQISNKLPTCESAISKIVETIDKLCHHQPFELRKWLSTQNQMPLRSLYSFRWNSKKYSHNRPLHDLIEDISCDITSCEADVFKRFAIYNEIEHERAALVKSDEALLNEKSLKNVLSKAEATLDSEYLTYSFIAVPKDIDREWLSSYETISQMVVPRSAIAVSEDNEFRLYRVIVFKKFENEFAKKCRENKYFPRNADFDEDSKKTGGNKTNGKNSEYGSSSSQSGHGKGADSSYGSRADSTADGDDMDEDDDQYGHDLSLKERLKILNDKEKISRYESLLFVQVVFHDAFEAYAHLKVIHTFIESVLRYGLPPNFCAVLMTPIPSTKKKVKRSLDKEFSYLGIDDNIDLIESSALARGKNIYPQR